MNVQLTALHVVHQSAADLTLAVTRSDLEPVALRVLAAETLTIGEWHFEFQVLAESHRVRVEHGGRLVLQELLLCASVDRSACAHYHPCRDLHPHDAVLDGYAVSLRFDQPLDQGLPGAIGTLTARFPAVEHMTPSTRISWWLLPDRLLWTTAHTYPDQHKITVVYTRSHFLAALSPWHGG
jgi:hypothetical protein